MHRRVAILGACALVSAAFVAPLPACSSSSSGSGAVDGGGGTDSASSSSSGGGSSGASSGGASGSSGAGSSSSGSSGVTSSGSSSGSTGGDTMLVTGRQRMSGLTMVGSNLYWVESGRGIFNVPVNGDIATAVYLNAYLGSALGTDGTRLFFTQVKSGANEVDSVATDGTGEQALATGTFNLAAADSAGPQIFVVNGTAYVNGVANILAIPAGDGGAPAAVVSPAPSSSVQALLWADSSGIYYTDMSGNVYWVALAGGAATKIYANTVTGYGGPPPGDLAIVGGAAYFLVLGAGLQSIDLMTSTAGATATKVASYTMENGNASGVAADGKGGLYELVGGSTPGIYSASLASGTQTAVDVADTGLANVAGPMHAVDSNHIYFVESGIGNFSIWSH